MLKNAKKPILFIRLPLTLAIVGCLYGPALFAQEAVETKPAPEKIATEASEVEDGPKSDEATTLDRVTVTGSLISRLGFDTISPVQVITADTSISVGQLDTASILQTTSVAAGSTQISNQFSGFVIEGGTGTQSLSLRGLDANRTLVLLDGRRPGPAGTRGQVGAFDLNVIPSIILQRAEILKDGGGSIYGSDAVAGVVNLITRKNVDKTELSVDATVPFDSGGTRYNISGATGWNFDSGNVVAAFQWFDAKPLKVGDRDFFKCSTELVRDAQGNVIPYEDRSITRGTPLEGCLNLYANTVIDFGNRQRYVPSPDGVSAGPIPGYRPRRNRPFNPATGAAAFYEDVQNFDFFGDTHIFTGQERASLFTSADFNFGDINWSGQFLYNNRQTESRRFRQFFPTINGVPLGFAGDVQPIMPFRSDQNINVDYFYLATGLGGIFGPQTAWNWRVDTSYTRSDGDYEVLSIVADRSGDIRFDTDGALPVNFFDPGFLSGERINELQDAVGEFHTGNTIYDQFVVTATATGEIMELPAGAVGAAVGTEFRRYSIDDQPSELERSGNLWGSTSAQPTVGRDYVHEIFAEIDVPLISGKPGFEQLSFNGSARTFNYDTTDGSDFVWKAGLGWQIIPSVRLRATRGTSFRAPGLYELYLGNLTGFVGQLGIDPCIDWGNSSNPNIQANCAADGIPADYAGGGSSATIITGGGFGVVKPESSEAFTAGIVLTPTFADLSISVDYFEIDVRDQISQLGGASIVGSCYALPVFPNAFCGLFDRNPATANEPFRVTEVRDSYININQQLVRGYDLNLRYDHEFGFGKLEIESQFTKTIEDIQLLFDTAQASGFNTNDQNGIISRPQLVGNLRTALTRGDWTYTWFMRYVEATENFFVDPVGLYRGTSNAVYDIRAQSRLYHTLAVRYQSGNWDAVLGVENILDDVPPNISSGVGSTRYGTVPAFATQYDWYGRSGFLRVNYQF